jgi:ABC-type multidrug transport system ATPase subunit
MMSKTSPSTSHRLTVSSIGGVKARRGSSLSFHDLNVTVQDSEKQILYSVAGSVEPGEMLAIMGPSGKITSYVNA